MVGNSGVERIAVSNFEDTNQESSVQCYSVSFLTLISAYGFCLCVFEVFESFVFISAVWKFHNNMAWCRL